MLVWLVCPLAAHATPATLTADAHVNSALPAVNSGAISNLDVGGGYTALLQFDLSMLPQGTTAAQVSRAVLRLYANRVTTSGSVSLAAVNGTWGEYSVSFATQPAVAGTAGTFPVTQAGAFVAVDVTALVQGWIGNPASNNGLALSAATAVVQFDSKENDQTAHQATLEIELTNTGQAGAAGSAGPTGATGATGAPGPQGVAGAQGSTGPAGAAGAKGANGATGATGTAGSQGLQGIQGPAGPAGTGTGSSGGFIYQGSYSSVQNYALGDVVVWQGSSYTSLIASNHGNTPSFSPQQWGVLTAQGPAGPTGAAGTPGAPGPQGLPGSVGPNGPQGAQGVQGIAGQAGAQGIPGVTGATGLSGPMGPEGVPGPVGLHFQGPYSSVNNYAIADGVSYNGAGYVSLVASNHGNTPGQSPQQWALFAAAGTPGATGPPGTTGATGPLGPQGLQGIAGDVGATGATGPQGPAVANYLGSYQSSANYALHDAVSWQGSTYVSLTSGNIGNTPSLSAIQWAVLAAQGATGAPGPAGAVGATGSAGQAGANGATGPQGPPVTFDGGWLIVTSYATGDAVSYAGSAYIALTANLGRQPDISPVYWGLLSASGAPGPAGATGATGMQGPAGYSGQQGVDGPQGPTGATGSIGPAGATGPAGPAGPIGPTGATGLTGMVFRGAYTSATNYGTNDAVTYQGSAYLSLAPSNSGNTPGQSPSFWTILATAGAAGTAGATGPTGAQGLAGAAGATGASGSSGPAGPAGPTGLNYRGAWSNQAGYTVKDAVSYGGSTYIAQSANTSAEPDLYPQAWALLAQSGSLGPSGPAGTAGPAATVSVGSVTTGAAGSQAVVTNSGNSSAAVLNFTIPQGAAGPGGSGGGGGGGTSGVPFASVFHLVQNNIPGYPYYSVNNSNGSASELAPRSVLTWLPSGCTATSLQVHSEQGGTITVTLRTGATSASMANSPDLVCSALTANNSCTATGSDIIPAGGFVDLVISGANNSSGGVWTALTCN